MSCFVSCIKEINLVPFHWAWFICICPNSAHSFFLHLFCIRRIYRGIVIVLSSAARSMSCESWLFLFFPDIFQYSSSKTSYARLGFSINDVILFHAFRQDIEKISVKIFFDLTLVTPVKIPIFMFLLPRLIARAYQPDGNMTSFTLHFSRLT